MTTTVTHSKATKYLPLFTWDYRRGRYVGRMHLAQVKSTKKPVTVAWCGKTFRVHPTAKVTGEVAALLVAADADQQPTCMACLNRIRAWDWEW